MIRRATQDDVPQLVQWMERLVAHVQERSNDPYVVNVEEGYEIEFSPWFIKIIQSDSAAVFVAEEDGCNGVGFVVGTITAPFLKASAIKRIGQIDLCWVEPTHRKKGIARQLCSQAESWFKDRDIKYIDLQYLVGYTEAEKSWINLGYRPYRISARKEI